MFARHLGFLVAKPEEWPESGPQSRWEAHTTLRGTPPPMPRVEAGEYLLQAWSDLGKVEVNPGMGTGPLRFAEIVAGCPWTNEVERRIIRRMSEGYLSGIDVGENALGIAPWEEDE